MESIDALPLMLMRRLNAHSIRTIMQPIAALTVQKEVRAGFFIFRTKRIRKVAVGKVIVHLVLSLVRLLDALTLLLLAQESFVIEMKALSSGIILTMIWMLTSIFPDGRLVFFFLLLDHLPSVIPRLVMSQEAASTGTFPSAQRAPHIIMLQHHHLFILRSFVVNLQYQLRLRGVPCCPRRGASEISLGKDLVVSPPLAVHVVKHLLKVECSIHHQ